MGRGVLCAAGAAMLFASACWASGALAAECGGATGDATARIAACSADLNAAASLEAEVEILVLRAGEYRRADDLAKARADIEQALAINKDKVDAYLELGRIQRDEGDEQAALTTFERASKLDPSNWRAVLNRMDLLANAGRPEECLALSETALELAADQAQTHAYLGRCQSDMGRHEEALTHMEKARSMGLDEAFLHSNLSLEYLAADRKQEALAAAEHAVSLDPSHEHSQASLLDALLALGRFEDAVRAHKTATEAVGEDEKVGISNALAWRLYLAGEYDLAIGVIEGYLADHELSADNYYEADTYAHILSALGQGEEAVQRFLEAVELRGVDQDAFYRQKLAAIGIKVGDGHLPCRNASNAELDAGLIRQDTLCACLSPEQVCAAG